MAIALRSWWKRSPRRCPGKVALHGRLGVERLEDRIVFASDTLSTATALSFVTWPGATVQVAHASGFLATPNEVDLYKVSLNAGDQAAASIDSLFSGGALQSLLRVFDSSGKQLALDDQEGGDARLTFQAPANDAYFIGVSSDGDDGYNPVLANSGHGGASSGLYKLNLQWTPENSARNRPNLTGSAFGLTTTTTAYGETVSGSFTIENCGGAASRGFSFQVGLSTGTQSDAFAQTSSLDFLTSTPPSTFVVNPSTPAEGPLVLVVTLVADTLPGEGSGNSTALLVHASPQTQVAGENADQPLANALTAVGPPTAGPSPLEPGLDSGPSEVDLYLPTEPPMPPRLLSGRIVPEAASLAAQQMADLLWLQATPWQFDGGEPAAQAVAAIAKPVADVPTRLEATGRCGEDCAPVVVNKADRGIWRVLLATLAWRTPTDAPGPRPSARRGIKPGHDSSVSASED